MDSLADTLLLGLRKLISQHLGEFLAVQGILLTADVISRLVTYRRQLDSASKNRKLEGWFNVCAVGPDLCLVALAGVFVSVKIVTAATTADVATFHQFCAIAILLLLIIAAFILGSSPKNHRA